MFPITADKIKPNDTNERVVLGYFTHLMAGDLAAFEQIWAKDAVQEHVYNFEGLTPALVGGDVIIAHYRRMFRGRRNMVFTIKGFHRTVNPEVIIVEFHGRSEVKETGKIFAQTYIDLFTLRVGKITLHRMYADPRIGEAAVKGLLLDKG